MSKKLTEEGLGSTTSLTKTQQREVRKKLKNGHKPIREVKSIRADSTSRKQGKVKRLDPKSKWIFK